MACPRGNGIRKISQVRNAGSMRFRAHWLSLIEATECNHDPQLAICHWPGGLRNHHRGIFLAQPELKDLHGAVGQGEAG